MSGRERGPSVRAVLGWALAAFAGLVLAAAVTLAASKLSNQRIGLAGEPLTAGHELTPARALAVQTTPPTSPPGRSEDHRGSGDD